jgi:hypothetical protein
VNKPATLLRQNSELKADRIWNWTLPAFAVRLADGRTMNVCPKAGACANFCYALNGTYMFRNVRGAHERNLVYVLDHLDEWKNHMIEELQHKKFRPNGIERFAAYDLQLKGWTEGWRLSGGAAVRIHDSGDFFSVDYLKAWLEIAYRTPDVLFYAYTKDVTMFREHAEGKTPVNFRYVFSMGGKEDHLVDKDTDRHADVFPSLEVLADLGYLDQEDSDLLAVLLPTTRIGIVSNNIPHFNKKMAGRSFSELQVERDEKIQSKFKGEQNG